MSEQHICPRFIIWRRIFAILDEAWRKRTDPQIPPPPNVFNFQGWSKSSDQKKHAQWKKTLDWARTYGFFETIPELYEEDMFDGHEGT